jgi:hypothetical protein
MTDRTQPDFAAVDRRLRQILEPLRPRLSVTKDGPGGLVLEIPGLEGKPWGYVAGIRPGRRYVSYYLMPVYALPELASSMSPELRRRMQGKSCFNFSRVDERLFGELARITQAGFEPYLAFAAEVAGGKVPARSRQEAEA